MIWTRQALEARVAALAAEHEGAELVAAVQRLAAELEEDEREVLGRILLERAHERGAYDAGLVGQIEAPGWFRRQLEWFERRSRARRR